MTPFKLFATAAVATALFASAVCAAGKPELTQPKSPEMNQKAPNVYKAKFETSKGDFVIEVHREWAPLGADRFYNLVQGGFYDDCRFFRVVKGFMAQFGINGDPKVQANWVGAKIQDDPVKGSNKRGFVTYAMGGPNSRTSQIFINYIDNSRLDGMGFAPFGQVVQGMDIVDALHSGYGDGPPSGTGPNQGRIQSEGNAYLSKEFPKLDWVRKASIVPAAAK
jgi:peptidyl-prolyl cis-trans isomerase A (cyclophilin A)